MPASEPAQGWTKELLKVVRNGAFTDIGRTGGGPPIVNWPGFDDSRWTLEERRANAGRLVTCWNAMLSISDPAAFVRAADAMREAAERYYMTAHGAYECETALSAYDSARGATT